MIASYSEVSVVTRSLSTLIRELESSAYAVVLVRASDNRHPLVWPEGRPDILVVRKPNIGYDFGSWAIALDRFPTIRRKPFVILANDSLVGPFDSLRPLIESFETTAADVWGITQTLQLIPHLQTYFLGFRRGVLNDSALKQFWRLLPIETSKDQIIQRYELGLSRRLFAEGFAVSSYVDSYQVAAVQDNPTIAGWRGLLRLGVPFVKRQLLLDPSLAHDGAELPEVLKSTFGEDPLEWIEPQRRDGED